MHIEASRTYSVLFRHIQQAPCVTLTYSQPCHILSPGIFRIEGILKTLQNSDQAYSKCCLSQNSLFRHYSAIFRHIQHLVKHLHMQKPGIFGILEISEPFHNCILMHIQNPAIFMETGKPCVTLDIQNSGILVILEYSKPWHI